MAAVNRVLSAVRGCPLPVVVLATALGEALREVLTQNGIGHMDLAGNCHLELHGGNVSMHIEGKRASPQPAPSGSLRAAGYRALVEGLLIRAPCVRARRPREVHRAGRCHQLAQ